MYVLYMYMYFTFTPHLYTRYSTDNIYLCRIVKYIYSRTSGVHPALSFTFGLAPCSSSTLAAFKSPWKKKYNIHVYVHVHVCIHIQSTYTVDLHAVNMYVQPAPPHMKGYRIHNIEKLTNRHVLYMHVYYNVHVHVHALWRWMKCVLTDKYAQCCLCSLFPTCTS